MPNVIVTGGSRGIGLGIVRRLAADGHDVIAVARKEGEALPAAAEEAARCQCGSITFVPFDLGEVEGLSDLVRSIRASRGPIGGLVNNAGIGTAGVLANMSEPDIGRLIRLNTLSPILLTKQVVRTMLTRQGGRIVNIASIVASSGYSGLSVYSATKASLVGFTRSLARELGALGITVNAVAPGFVATEMTHALEAGDLERIARRSALRRMAEVTDVAAAVSFLVGEEARNITGQVLTVDAGNTV